VHVLEESGKVNWNLLVSNEILGIVTHVQLSDELSACLIDSHDGFRELEILFFGVLEANRSKVFKLFVCSFRVFLSFRRLQFDALLAFKVGDSRKVFGIVRLSILWLEATKMFAIVYHHSEERNKVDSNLDCKTLLF